MSLMSPAASPPIVVAFTGASGAVYAMRLVQVLAELGHRVDLAISLPARQVLSHELGVTFSPEQFDAVDFLRQAITVEKQIRPTTDRASFPSLADAASRLRLHDHTDYLAPIASGSEMGSSAVRRGNGGPSRR